jgi:hypothetical protein
MRPKRTSKSVNVGRHEANCSICAHPNRADIERDFIDWQSPKRIAEEYGLSGRTPIYRHASALGLLTKRERNIRVALVKIIEKAGEVDVTAQSVVAAIQAYSKINAAGQWIERTEHIDLNALFDRMTRDELEKYAQEGNLPDWFIQSVPDTPIRSQETVSD